MKILITGVNGQVGHALMHELTEHELIGLTRKDCDLINLDQIRKVIDQHQPDLIINPAAYTKVDQAEEEPELAFQINRDAPKVMAEMARKYNIPLIHFSTDYVFDGRKKESYCENDTVNPLNVYGKSKLAGEEAIQSSGCKYIIFRTSWVYSDNGINFYLKVRNLLYKNQLLKIVDDQFGVPTSSKFIAFFIAENLPKMNNICGIYNLTANGHATWFSFAKEIAKLSNYTKSNIERIKSDQINQVAKRPKYSVLNNNKVKKKFNLKIKSWQFYLRDYL